jgi:nicotinate-nucleotide adenylyltransferase
MLKGKMARIGIFGGTFNPPHAGHLIVAETICEQLNLDKLFFVPSYISPHKKKGEDELAAHRVRMVRLAISSNPRFDFSDIEVKRRGTSFTYETVKAFSRNYPVSKLFLIIGADNFSEFHTWKYPERIIDAASLVVMNRPFYRSKNGKKKFFQRARFITVPGIEISSTEIRSMVRQGKSIRYLVPQPVFRYIQRNRLYR